MINLSLYFNFSVLKQVEIKNSVSKKGLRKFALKKIKFRFSYLKNKDLKNFVSKNELNFFVNKIFKNKILKYKD